MLRMLPSSEAPLVNTARSGTLLQAMRRLAASVSSRAKARFIGHPETVITANFESFPRPSIQPIFSCRCIYIWI